MQSMDDGWRLARTRIPTNQKLKVIIDSDTYNEVDDQFAILFAMLSPERIELQAVYAALFHNQRSSSPADGMEKSYQEILRIFHLMGEDPKGRVFRGCDRPIESPDRYVPGEAVDDLIRRAMAQPEGEPLYVVGIGACTNLASALIREPRIAEKVVAVWLLGNIDSWPNNREFNLSQDPVGAKLLFDSGIPFIQVPAFGVTGYLTTSVPELEYCLGGANPICDFLVDNVKGYHDDHFAWSKAIWDVGAIGLLINPNWAPMKVCNSPVLLGVDYIAHDPSRHLIRSVYNMDRDGIFRDLFTKLRAANAHDVVHAG